MTKAPKKLYHSTIDRLLGRVSPSLFHLYLRSGDPEVVEFAKKTGYYPEWQVGTVYCNKCKRKWVAVRPIKTENNLLECPKCGYIGAHTR